jgi:site-specific DNA-methyltransferase (adenine-specific)
MLNSNPHNPDVLTCLANLSSDEVFTPPKLANEILDHLPKELWSDPEAKFLDPFCKSGVFLREIAKRLLIGLEAKIPDQQERINHIFKHQIYGIAITELTALLCRRSVYCSKTANGEYSVCDQFDDVAGNIRFERGEHTWENGKCIYCGASQDELGRGEEYEGYAYEFIHTETPEEIFNMKFDVIVGNPPYQLDTGGTGKQAKPIYQKFVTQAQKLSPRYLSMVIPARWFAGGMGLDEFRSSMLSSKHITKLVDHPIANSVFPGVKIIGGVCYFLWERDRTVVNCEVTTIMKDHRDTSERPLDQFDKFVRFNRAIPILEKVINKGLESLSKSVSSTSPFGLETKVRPKKTGDITLYANNSVGKFNAKDILQGRELLPNWKVLLGMAYGEGGEKKEYPRNITARAFVVPPKSACTMTYIVIASFNNERTAENCVKYLSTRFVRFLINLRKNTQHITKDRFHYVPAIDFTKAWDDDMLYKHFGITEAEAEFIAELINPLD